MNRMFAMMRYSKKLMWFFISVLIEILLIFSIIIFDVIQLCLITKNNAMLSGGFIFFNILLISIAVINLILIVCFVIIKRGREKSNEFKKD